MEHWALPNILCPHCGQTLDIDAGTADALGIITCVLAACGVTIRNPNATARSMARAVLALTLVLIVVIAIFAVLKARGEL